MPWCEDCAKYFAPSAMNADGTCPTCGRSLERPAEPRRPKRGNKARPTDDPPAVSGDPARPADDPVRASGDPSAEDRGAIAEPITAKNLNLHKLAAGDDRDEEDMKAPWHFKLLLVLLTIYLTWRFVQLFT
jgi:hypothetical protein